MKISLLLLLAAVLCAPAWAINKCTGPDGKFVFQDKPCTGQGEKLTVRPASGNGDTPPVNAPGSAAPSAAASQPAKPATEAQRIEARIAESQRMRRRQEFEVLLVPNAWSALSKLRTQCDSDIKALQDKKALSKNNLAGATWESSISQEMQAIATRCDTRTRELKDDYEATRQECLALGGCKQL